MAEKYIQLRNVSDEPQHVYDENTKRRWTLAERTVLPFPADIAKLFLSGDRAKYVQVYAPTPIPEIPGEVSVWVANMTGNPFAPKRRQNRKGELVDNPNLTAAPLTREMHVPQTSDKDKDGYLKVTNHPPVKIELLPYVRTRCPLSTALWLEGRDGQQEPEAAGKLVRCRAPTAFEPNETWEYDDIRVYASLVNANDFDIVKDFPPISNAQDQEAKKTELLRRLFFKLVDDRVSLPSKEYYDVEYAKLRSILAATSAAKSSTTSQPRK